MQVSKVICDFCSNVKDMTKQTTQQLMDTIMGVEEDNWAHDPQGGKDMCPDCIEKMRLKLEEKGYFKIHAEAMAEMEAEANKPKSNVVEINLNKESDVRH